VEAGRDGEASATGAHQLPCVNGQEPRRTRRVELRRYSK